MNYKCHSCIQLSIHPYRAAAKDGLCSDDRKFFSLSVQMYSETPYKPPHWCGSSTQWDCPNEGTAYVFLPHTHKKKDLKPLYAAIHQFNINWRISTSNNHTVKCRSVSKLPVSSWEDACHETDCRCYDKLKGQGHDFKRCCLPYESHDMQQILPGLFDVVFT